MNMSGQYSGPYYHPFGPPSQGFGQPPPNQYRPPFPNNPRDNPTYPPSFPPPQNFAEYSLWGNSSYNPTDLIRPNTRMFHQHPSPPYPPPVPFTPIQFRRECPPPRIPEVTPENTSEAHNEVSSECPEVPPENPEEPEPSVPPDQPSLEQEIEEGGSDEPELTGLEEPEKTVIKKEDLYRCSDSENSDADGDVDDNPDTVDQASNSSGSSCDWTQTNFQRANYPPPYPWASRPSRVVNNRGRKSNIMQRRLVMALSQPVKFDKGASMMQRMGWMGGGLGRDGDGIVDPIAPNAIYATSTVGFGQETPVTPKKTKKKPPPRPKKSNAKKNKGLFKTNVLQILLDFVKNDLLLELYFDTHLTSIERKRIHKLVAGLEGREETEGLDTVRQQEVVNEIHRRNNYTLSTQSDGEGAERQICVYKSAPSHMFLVTPDDCRPCVTEIKEIEEENPFMKSITKHIRVSEGSVLKPRAPHLFDILLQFFMEFCGDDLFTEFRFVGPFTRREIYVINNFFSLVGDLSEKQKPFFKVPVELLDVFATPNYRFLKDSAPNGFTAIKKEPFNLKKEFDKQEEEKRKKRALDHHPANLLAMKGLTSKIV